MTMLCEELNALETKYPYLIYCSNSPFGAREMYHDRTTLCPEVWSLSSMRMVMSFIMEKDMRGGHRRAKTDAAAFQLEPRLFWA